MPDRDDTTSPAARTDAGPEAQQQRPSRRSVLRGAAGAGVAAASWPAAPAGTKDLDSAEPIVVHVRDARSGEIDVFRGTSQTRVHDRELAARLVRASR